jgi:hypothetical protein
MCDNWGFKIKKEIKMRKFILFLFIFNALSITSNATTERVWLSGRNEISAHCGSGIEDTYYGYFKSYIIDGNNANCSFVCDPDPECTCYQSGYDGIGIGINFGWYVDFVIPAMGVPPPSPNDVTLTLEFYPDEQNENCWHVRAVVIP